MHIVVGFIIIIALIAIFLYHRSRAEGFRSCWNCNNMQRIPTGLVRNPFYWPYAGDYYTRNLANEYVKMPGTCGQPAYNIEQQVRLAHQNEPDHVPQTE